ncbi:hypothetical protein V8C86DRAFT_2763562 [Haematococcus lacustris]
MIQAAGCMVMLAWYLLDGRVAVCRATWLRVMRCSCRCRVSRCWPHRIRPGEQVTPHPSMTDSCQAQGRCVSATQGPATSLPL